MAIEANLDKYLTKVNQTKDFLSGHRLEQYSFRREAMDILFSVLEKALENDKDEVVMQALSTVEGILKESPL